MSRIEQRWFEFRHMDELSAGNSLVHQLHPGVKLLATLVFVIVTASFPKYEIAAMVPLLLYPLFLISLADLPWGLLLRRLLLGLPFAVFIGVFNPLFDQTPLYQIGPVTLSGGVVSFFSILLRFSLSVLAALALIATTGINALGAALQAFGVPRALVNQILFMYRYLHVLMEEVVRTLRAHSLRSPEREAVRIGTWGSLTGLLLLRTLDRAQRVYQAMLCRGFDGEVRLMRSSNLRLNDGIFLLIWLCFFVTIRIFNFPQWLGALLMGR
ncbi:cobalt ABC transporter permease [Anaerosporomusa subterranea]|uniref:Cobalt ABC transporter permease n=1 Tax=Anaerosporomusa subterranea TaxID=1794912 RepID=A0A154BW04_ANASB|nr:cobalt ECF transporter T component CbiQ [Anaerosporomusa subterranea]KYZ78119.1 cobalt ABC transporter permease [Anaerosporomusa subterranea]